MSPVVALLCRHNRAEQCRRSGVEWGAGQALLNLEDLRVVRRDDDNIVESDRFLLPLPIDPCRATRKNRPHELANCLRLFGRRILVAVVLDRQEIQARPVCGTRPLDDLLFETIL